MRAEGSINWVLINYLIYLLIYSFTYIFHLHFLNWFEQQQII